MDDVTQAAVDAAQQADYAAFGTSILWRALPDARVRNLLASARADLAAACPTPCDPDCEQPCHEAHQMPSRRDHGPMGCVGTIVAEAAAAERSRLFVAIRHAIPLNAPWRGEALDLIAALISPPPEGATPDD